MNAPHKHTDGMFNAVPAPAPPPGDPPPLPTEEPPPTPDQQNTGDLMADLKRRAQQHAQSNLLQQTAAAVQASGAPNYNRQPQPPQQQWPQQQQQQWPQQQQQWPQQQQQQQWPQQQQQQQMWQQQQQQQQQWPHQRQQQQPYQNFQQPPNQPGYQHPPQHPPQHQPVNSPQPPSQPPHMVTPPRPPPNPPPANSQPSWANVVSGRQNATGGIAFSLNPTTNKAKPQPPASNMFGGPQPPGSQPTHTRHTIHKPSTTGSNNVPLGKPKPPGGASGGSGAYPAALGQFVTRAFSACKSDKDREAMRTHLDAAIAKHREQGDLWEHDWSNEPIPNFQFVSLRGNLSDRMGGNGLGQWQSMPSSNNEKGGKKKKNKKRDRSPPPDTPEEARRKAERAKRFSGAQQEKKVKRASHSAQNAVFRDTAFSRKSFLWDTPQIVKGTSTALEKAYLRLTSAPDPSTVRPLVVLKEALVRLRKKWEHDPNFAYTNEQLKSIRQDLTVQHINNDFTVEVYEYNSRLALENGDLSEFNQCQTQLLELHDVLNGSIMEFVAYNILYQAYAANMSDVTHLLAKLDPATLADKAVSHACQVHVSIVTCNFVQFFRLFRTCPNMGRFILVKFVDRIRMMALKILCQGFHPKVSMDYVEEHMGFIARKECLEHLATLGAVYTDASRNTLDTKKTLEAIAQRPAQTTKKRGARRSIQSRLNATGI